MSRAAYQARLRNLARWNRPRSYQQSRSIELQIALWTHRGRESVRDLARRLGLRSHAHCWRVARTYRRGLIPMLPRDEHGLVSMRDSLASEVPAAVGVLTWPAQGASRHCTNCGYNGASIYAGWPAGPVFEKYSDEHGITEICRRCRADRACYDCHGKK